jgi:hypothetical protein
MEVKEDMIFDKKTVENVSRQIHYPVGAFDAGLKDTSGIEK